MTASQKKAVRNYRKRLVARGLTRFEVLGREDDRELIRSLARRMAEDGSDSLRARLVEALSPEPARKGGLVAALRRSPLVGADLDLTRESTPGREIDL